MLTRDEDLIHCAGSISKEDDDRLAAEEAGLSEIDILRGSLVMLQKQILRLQGRIEALERKVGP